MRNRHDIIPYARPKTMICTECKTSNPVGNKFCRECGVKLSPVSPLAAEEAAAIEAERKQERVAELLAGAFALSDENRPDEALPLAQEAADLLPESSSALVLLASLYERTDQPDLAIATMERVVALNPDSEATRKNCVNCAAAFACCRPGAP
jgi:tetratricopeptide (TPR) repeat protein